MTPNIRQGTKADIPAALTLVRELATFEKAPGEVEVTVAEMEAWGFGPDKQFDFFVADEQGIITGIALYYYKYSTWKGKCLFLEDIIVTESRRGHGIGRLLFDAVVRIAKTEKVKRMEWQVLNWNAPAISFYQQYKAQLDDEWINCKLTGEQLRHM